MTTVVIVITGLCDPEVQRIRERIARPHSVAMTANIKFETGEDPRSKASENANDTESLCIQVYSANHWPKVVKLLSEARCLYVGIVHGPYVPPVEVLKMLVQTLNRYSWIGTISPSYVAANEDNNLQKHLYRLGYSSRCVIFRSNECSASAFKKALREACSENIVRSVAGRTRGLPPFRWGAVGKVPVLVNRVEDSSSSSEDTAIGQGIVRSSMDAYKSIFSKLTKEEYKDLSRRLMAMDGDAIRPDEPSVDVVYDCRCNTVPLDSLVTVVLPCYNRSNTFGDTVEAVRCQTYESIELIIVDDGSSEDMFTIARERMNDSGMQWMYVKLSHNAGPGHARFVGARMSRGAYVSYLDSDDLLHPDKIRHQVAILKQNPHCVMTYAWTAVIRSSDVKYHSTLGLTDSENESILDMLLVKRRLGWTTSGILWRQSLAAPPEAWQRLYGPEDVLYEIESAVRCDMVVKTPSDVPLLLKRDDQANISAGINENIFYQMEIIKMYDYASGVLAQAQVPEVWRIRLGELYFRKVMAFLVFRHYSMVDYLIQQSMALGYNPPMYVRAASAIRRSHETNAVYRILRKYMWFLRIIDNGRQQSK